MKRLIAALVLLLVLVAVPARAAEIYVNCSATATGGDGSSGDPYRDITTALAAANNGDIIYVQGNCREDTLTVVDNNIQIRKWPGVIPPAVITGNSTSPQSGVALWKGLTPTWASTSYTFSGAGTAECPYVGITNGGSASIAGVNINYETSMDQYGRRYGWLRAAANVAGCQATDGSYYLDTGASPPRLHVNPYGTISGSMSGKTVRVARNNAGLYANGTNGLVLYRLDFGPFAENSSDNSGAGAAWCVILDGVSNVHASECRFYDAGRHAFGWTSGSGTTVENCTIDKCWAGGISYSDSTSFVVNTGAGGIIRNVAFTDTTVVSYGRLTEDLVDLYTTGQNIGFYAHGATTSLSNNTNVSYTASSNTLTFSGNHGYTHVAGRPIRVTVGANGLPAGWYQTVSNTATTIVIDPTSGVDRSGNALSFTEADATGLTVPTAGGIEVKGLTYERCAVVGFNDADMNLQGWGTSNSLSASNYTNFNSYPVKLIDCYATGVDSILYCDGSSAIRRGQFNSEAFKTDGGMNSTTVSGFWSGNSATTMMLDSCVVATDTSQSGGSNRIINWEGELCLLNNAFLNYDTDMSAFNYIIWPGSSTNTKFRCYQNIFAVMNKSTGLADDNGWLFNFNPIVGGSITEIDIKGNAYIGISKPSGGTSYDTWTEYANDGSDDGNEWTGSFYFSDQFQSNSLGASIKFTVSNTTTAQHQWSNFLDIYTNPRTSYLPGPGVNGREYDGHYGPYQWGDLVTNVAIPPVRNRSRP